MPVLNWIGKEAVVKHHKEVPFRLLEPVPELSCADAESGNLIVEGDNLHALKALLPRYAGQVKCIYIDPPYNTGKEGWAYNDNVKSPEIQKWLDEAFKGYTIDKDTLDRHDRWLCMMYPRLVLLRQFLREDGVLFVSMDDNEVANARLLLNEIFGPRNFVGSVVWKNVTDNNPTRIVPEHEYLLCFAKNIEKNEGNWKTPTLSSKTILREIEHEILSASASDEDRRVRYREWLRENKPYVWPFQDYKFIDEGGIFTGIRGVHNPGKEGYRYDVLHPVTGKPCTEPLMGYRFPESTMKELIEADRIIFGEDESKIIELKVYLKDYQAKLSSVYELDGRAGTNEVKAIFPEVKKNFDHPKSVQLIQDMIAFTTQKDSLVLDSFGGSGTTGHAVLKQNAEDGGNRNFILVEMDSKIAHGVTAERVRRVAKGYKKANGDKVDGHGGGFGYYRLSAEPLFEAGGPIRTSITFSELAEFVWFMETGSGMQKPARSKGVTDSPYLGRFKERAVFLLYNGILKDKTDTGGNVLNGRTLELLEDLLPAFDGLRVIYGARSRFDKSKLAKLGITFHQLPYDLATKTWF
jgi:adenine-specific DNA-methyltransferase